MHYDALTVINVINCYINIQDQILLKILITKILVKLEMYLKYNTNKINVFNYLKIRYYLKNIE